jgi:hypothetical protein
MAEYWFIYRMQLYGRDELVGRINYSGIHFMKEVVWKFMDWLEERSNIYNANNDLNIKTWHCFRYPRNMIRFRVLVEGDNLNADLIKEIQNNFTERVSNYRSDGKRENFIDNDGGVDFNNAKTLEAVGTPYGGPNAVDLALDFMNILAEFNRELHKHQYFNVSPEDYQSRILRIVYNVKKEIFKQPLFYPCICGNDINLEMIELRYDETQKLNELGKRLHKFNHDINELIEQKKTTGELENIANNYADLVFLTFGLFQVSFICEKCGELLDIRIR